MQKKYKKIIKKKIKFAERLSASRTANESWQLLTNIIIFNNLAIAILLLPSCLFLAVFIVVVINVFHALPSFLSASSAKPLTGTHTRSLFNDACIELKLFELPSISYINISVRVFLLLISCEKLCLLLTYSLS